MGNEKKEGCSGLNKLLRVTDKYYIGHDQHNVILYTKYVNKKTGELYFNNNQHFPTIETALNRIVELTEINSINPDLLKLITEIKQIKDDIKKAVANWKMEHPYINSSD